MATNIDKKNIITRQGLHELKEELKKLIEIERPKVIEDIKDARALGDLSENAEFDAAREKQGQIEDRIKAIEKIIDTSKIISTKSNSTSKTRIGSIVDYIDMSTNKENTVTIVGSLEADPFESKISNSSPLGEALLNVGKGDIVTVQVVDKYDVKIVSFKN
ncbi:MAG: transcription elongation factor GreA [Mycoplasmatales bacterium]|nr:transcription elongation factor GreA [Mycoplasmatales bacterium]